jgi:hypothetical protein
LLQEIHNKKQDSNQPNLLMLKKCHQSAEDKIIYLINLIKSIKSKRQNEMESKKKSSKTLQESTEIFLKQILIPKFGSKTPQDLYSFVSPDAVLKSSAIGSLNSQAFSYRNKKKLNAKDSYYDPRVEPSLFEGIGQISRASREFKTSLEEIISPSLLKNLNFEVSVNNEKVILNKSSDRLIVSFDWKSKGMKELGYSEEFSFHGLIYCNFENSLIKSSNIMFNPFSIIKNSSFNCQ